MATPTAGPSELTSQFLNKFMLPKIALTIIGVASLLGVSVTSWLEGIHDPFAIAVRWLIFATLGILLGSSLWAGFIGPWAESVRPAPGAKAFLAAEGLRFRVLHRIMAAAGSVAVFAYLLVALGGPDYPLRPLVLAGVALLAALAFWLPARDRRGARRAAALSALALALLALAEVSAEGMAPGGDVPLWGLVRAVHLLAFGAWFGGAAWNIFINAASGRETLCLDTVIASHLQLEGFRKVVRVAFPTIVLTGLLQAGFLSGPNLGFFVGTGIGLVVLTKLGLAGALVVIFFTCPMWGACSPIAGVCNIEDLAEAPVGYELSAVRMTNGGD